MILFMALTVRERDIMEIPASGRLFMGHRHAARIAVHENVGRTSFHVAWYRPHDYPAGTTITGRPFTFLVHRHDLPRRSSAGRIAVSGVLCCSRCEGREKQVRRSLCRPHVYAYTNMCIYVLCKVYYIPYKK